MNTLGMTARLRSHLDGVARRIRVQTVAYGSLAVVLVAATATVLVFLMDWLFRLPSGIRFVLLAASMGTLGWSILKRLLLPLRVKLNSHSVALLIEQRRPELKRELISALQLEKALESPDYNESRALTEESIRRAVEHVQETGLKGVVSARPLRRPLVFALSLLALVTIYTSFRPDHGALFVERCLLLRDTPWPARTRLDVEIIGSFRESTGEDGSRVIHVPENTVLRVRVTAIGEVPGSIKIHKMSPAEDGADSMGTVEVGGIPGENTFDHNFGKLKASFGFYTTGGDAHAKRPYFEVVVRTAPRITSLSVDLDLPSYVNDAGEPDRPDSREFNIVAPEGTGVTMRFETSLPLKSFHLVIDGEDGETVALKPTGDEGRLFEHTLTLEGDHFYSWRLIGANGAPGRDAPEFALSAQPDLPPELNIIRPETTSIDVTTRGVIPLRFAVLDDFAVGEVAALWDIDPDGVFSNRIVFPENQRREIAGLRNIEVFRLLEAASFLVPMENGERPLAAGDQLYCRLRASDTRRTTANPNPNTVSYPSLISFYVREEIEIERDLMRHQVRIKNDLERSHEASIVRTEEIDSLLALLSAGKAADELLIAIHERLAAQELLTTSLAEGSRSFVRVFDGFCFNRLDPSPLTEALINGLAFAHANRDGEHIDFLRELLPTLRPRMDDSESMGKIAQIMDLLLTTSGLTSQKVTGFLQKAANAQDVAQRAELIQQARSANEDLRSAIALILEKMEDWEDFQDVIQSLKDIIDLETGLWERMKRIAR